MQDEEYVISSIGRGEKGHANWTVGNEQIKCRERVFIRKIHIEKCQIKANRMFAIYPPQRYSLKSILKHSDLMLRIPHPGP